MDEAMKNHEAERSKAAIDRVRNTLTPEHRSVGERLANLHASYIPLDRDAVLRDALQASVLSVTAPITGRPDKRRIIAVVGNSGAGKTTALMKHISAIPAMQSYIDEDGVKVSPVLVMPAPSPCTPRLFAIEGIEALGHKPSDRIRENEAWLLFRRLLKVHKVMWLVVDESQHAIETATVRETTVIGDAFKALTQMEDWPVRLILAGVPPLASFLARKQLYNRRTVVPFDTLTAKGNNDVIAEVLEMIVVRDAGLKVGPDIILREEKGGNIDDDKGEDKKYDFLGRLLHSCDGEFGSVIQLIRAAAELSIRAGRDTIKLDDFVKTYASFSGCKPSKNIFTASDWDSIDPSTALHRAQDHAWEEERKKSKGKGATKFGVRPQ